MRHNLIYVMKRSVGLLDGEWIVGNESRSREATQEALTDRLDRGIGKE